MKKKNIFRLFVALSVVMGWLSCRPAFLQAKTTVGRLEHVKISTADMVFKAKLDTGADSCSLGVSNLNEFVRNGKKWVRFTVVNYLNVQKTVEKRLVRYTEIKRQKQAPMIRPVVRMGICLGRQFKQAEINLADRSGYDFNMLIGWRFLKGLFVVDPSKSYSTEPACNS